MLTLSTSDLCWINESPDDPKDQCAHGKVLMSVGDTVFADPAEGQWTVSAAALYLLRTIEDDHTPEDPVAESNFLFPCCGFIAWEIEGRYGVLCQGCNIGIDVWVRHVGSRVLLARGDAVSEIEASDWSTAVRSFAREVEAFYSRCSLKREPDDELDRLGWRAFWSEWRSRMGRETG